MHTTEQYRPTGLLCFEDPFDLEDSSELENNSQLKSLQFTPHFFNEADILPLGGENAAITSLPSLLFDSYDAAEQEVPGTPTFGDTHDCLFDFTEGLNYGLEEPFTQRESEPKVKSASGVQTAQNSTPHELDNTQISPLSLSSYYSGASSGYEGDCEVPNVVSVNGDETISPSLLPLSDSSSYSNGTNTIRPSTSGRMEPHWCEDNSSSTSSQSENIAIVPQQEDSQSSTTTSYCVYDTSFESSQSSTQSESDERRLDSCALEDHVVPSSSIEE